MKLDCEEKIKFSGAPNKKVLSVWFFTRTLVYSIVILILTFGVSVQVNILANPELITENHLYKSGASDMDVLKEMVDIIFIGRLVWVPAVISLILTIGIQIYFFFLWKTYRYTITNYQCIFAGGILRRVEISVPYKKITGVERSQNILERVLGIWSVHIFTAGIQAGQGGTEIKFEGVLVSEDLCQIINGYAMSTN